MSKFSVIMPVYGGDNPIHFKQAIQSLQEQTRLPDEIIVVVDGPIQQSTKSVLDEIKNNRVFKIIYQNKNLGPGVSRSNGIKASNHKIIALMDSDDISVNCRFEKQLDVIKNKKVDVVGSWIEEFIKLPSDLKISRRLPELHSEIYKFGKWRMPVNNVSLMFKKEVYEKTGGYTNQVRNEDWSLVVRMLASGAIFYNIQETLVHARAGNDMIRRRRGRDHFLMGLKIFTLMYKLKYINLLRAISNITIRVIIQFMPIGFTNVLYRYLLRYHEKK